MTGKFLVLSFLLFALCVASAANMVIAPSVALEDGNINVVIFYGRECPHCHKALTLLEELAVKNPAIKIEKIETWHSPENYQLFRETLQKYGYDPNRPGVPFIIIEDQIIEGYNPEKIRAAIVACGLSLDQNQQCVDENLPQTVNLLFFGPIDIRGFSLPMLSIVLGLADGFNPCAMWVLIYLISLMVVTDDKKKILLLAGTFVFASGVLYFLFLTAWLNLFLFIGFLTPVQIAVGIVALITGAMHLKTHLSKKEAKCEVTTDKQKRKIIDRINAMSKQAIVPATFLGIVFLAFTVNLIEFVCSAGIPAVFTKILAAKNLSMIEYYFYILLYDLAFMFDDLIIFGGAALTLQYTDFSHKYARIGGIIGGILLIVLGIILIFFPSALAAI
ncbi:MAG: glutaredoxin family protein [Candidatus Diapherotrites archaeon]